MFLQEKAKEKVMHSLKDGATLWKNLSEIQKEEYLKKAHKCILAYKYKKMIYNKKIKKMLPKKPGNAFSQFVKEKKGQKIPKGENCLNYWYKVFKSLTRKI